MRLTEVQEENADDIFYKLKKRQFGKKNLEIRSYYQIEWKQKMLTKDSTIVESTLCPMVLSKKKEVVYRWSKYFLERMEQPHKRKTY